MKPAHWMRAAGCLAAMCCAGCMSNALVLTTATRTGVEINASDGPSQTAGVGFERFEGVTMPLVYTDVHGKERTLVQAYPVYTKYEFHSGGLWIGKEPGVPDGLVLRQVFSTGEAAKKQTVRDKATRDFLRLQGHGGEFADQAVAIEHVLTGFEASTPEGRAAIRNQAVGLGLVQGEGLTDRNLPRRLRAAMKEGDAEVTRKLGELAGTASAQPRR